MSLALRSACVVYEVLRHGHKLIFSFLRPQIVTVDLFKSHN